MHVLFMHSGNCYYEALFVKFWNKAHEDSQITKVTAVDVLYGQNPPTKSETKARTSFGGIELTLFPTAKPITTAADLCVAINPRPFTDLPPLAGNPNPNLSGIFCINFRGSYYDSANKTPWLCSAAVTNVSPDIQKQIFTDKDDWNAHDERPGQRHRLGGKFMFRHWYTKFIEYVATNVIGVAPFQPLEIYVEEKEPFTDTGLPIVVRKMEESTPKQTSGSKEPPRIKTKPSKKRGKRRAGAFVDLS